MLAHCPAFETPTILSFGLQLPSNHLFYHFQNCPKISSCRNGRPGTKVCVIVSSITECHHRAELSPCGVIVSQLRLWEGYYTASVLNLRPSLPLILLSLICDELVQLFLFSIWFSGVIHRVTLDFGWSTSTWNFQAVHWPSLVRGSLSDFEFSLH